MIKDFLFRHTPIPFLKKGLDTYALRQKIIASNISNVSTPGYRRKEVVFEEKLENALQRHLAGSRTNERHLPIGPQRLQEVVPEVATDPSSQLPSGVNNVDIDREIVEQAKNAIRFAYGARMLRNHFAALRASIKGRFEQ